MKFQKEISPVQFLKSRLKSLFEYDDGFYENLFEDAFFKESEAIEMAYNQGFDDALDPQFDGDITAGEVYYKQKYGQ